VPGEEEELVPGKGAALRRLSGKGRIRDTRVLVLCFQGWYDMINPGYTAEYTANLTHFIRDVRKNPKVAKLPFVVGQMAVDGANPGADVKK
jgi:hypothetical protein